jgi:hypothetical protein
MEISLQGKIRVNNCYIVKKAKDLACIQVECKAKRFEVVSLGSTNSVPLIVIGPIPKVTLYLDKRFKSDYTEICFDDFKGYSVWSVTVSKYSVYVSLINFSPKEIVYDSLRNSK